METGNRTTGIGNVRGASSNWRQLNTGSGATGGGGEQTDRRIDLLASQRIQLNEYNSVARLNESFGSNHSGENIVRHAATTYSKTLESLLNNTNISFLAFIY